MPGLSPKAVHIPMMPISMGRQRRRTLVHPSGKRTGSSWITPSELTKGDRAHHRCEGAVGAQSVWLRLR